MRHNGYNCRPEGCEFKSPMNLDFFNFIVVLQVELDEIFSNLE